MCRYDLINCWIQNKGIRKSIFMKKGNFVITVSVNSKMSLSILSILLILSSSHSFVCIRRCSEVGRTDCQYHYHRSKEDWSSLKIMFVCVREGCLSLEII